MLCWRVVLCRRVDTVSPRYAASAIYAVSARYAVSPSVMLLRWVMPRPRVMLRPRAMARHSVMLLRCVLRCRRVMPCHRVMLHRRRPHTVLPRLCRFAVLRAILCRLAMLLRRVSQCRRDAVSPRYAERRVTLRVAWQFAAILGCFEENAGPSAIWQASARTLRVRLCDYTERTLSSSNHADRRPPNH